jgi:hypothetical protein
METTGGGMLARLSEKAVGWLILAGIVALGFAIYQMPSETKWTIWNGIWKTIVWVVLAAALPWSARLFLSKVLEFGSNWAGVVLIGVLIGAFVAIELLAGLLLMGGLPSGGWGWIAALGALLLAGTYNYLVTEYLADTVGV